MGILNHHYYAGIVETYPTILMVTVSLGGGWRGIAKKRPMAAFWTNVSLMLITPALFFATLPHLTYQKGETLILGQLGSVSARFVVSRPSSLSGQARPQN
ncbi:hypothetical protein [Alicyclobacillus sp. SO9]|uniref:hypothetical protein n=1 Tax=Alicyclobacillus sp. SO9 TaxID=2665646 RepID=UPI0018E8B133|nr:hypothetical protein [Alicyclobacillus sp. SO9]